MEWTAKLTKSHVLGGNPYLTLPKKLYPKKLFEVGDPIYIFAHPDKLFFSKISTFHSHCHTGYRLQMGWKDFVKELELAVGDECVFRIMFRFVPDNTPVIIQMVVLEELKELVNIFY